MKTNIGIDIGGSHISLGLVNNSGKILYKNSFDISPESSNNLIIEKITEKVNILSQKSKEYNNSDINSIGIGIPGITENGTVIVSPNLPKLNGFNFADSLKKKLIKNKIKKNILINNDANCAAYGEFLFGAGAKKNISNMIHITLGSGIGGGIILDKKIFSGSTGNAGEIGHITIKFDGIKCGCGNTGCWEAYAGAKGFIYLADRIIKTDYKNKKPPKNYFNFKTGKISPENISRAAFNKDKTALKIFDEYGKLIGIGIASLINLFNPQIISLGGGISNSYNLMKNSIINEAEKRAFSMPFENCKIVKGHLSNDAGLIGASSLHLL